MILVIALVIYADILVVLNLIVNYFLLLSVILILRCSVGTVRLILSALFGALSSLYIFLPQTSILAELGFKISICFVMTYIAFGFKSAKQFFKAAGMLFIVTCSYAGIMMAIWHIFKPNGMVINNSVVYFNISPFVLVGTSVSLYLIFLILNRIFRRSSPMADECDITVEIEEKKVELKAILDTGNSIADVFGKSEVIITDKKALQYFLGRTELSENGEMQSRFRLIPCNTISGEDMLEGFRCDSAVVKGRERTVTLKKPILAISKTPLNDGYNAIVNPKILD